MENPAANIQLALTLTDANKLPLLLEMLRHLDFVRGAEAEVNAPASATHVPAATAFDDLKGIWAGRDLTADQLRQQAWGGRAA